MVRFTFFIEQVIHAKILDTGDFCILSGKTKLSSEPQKTFETKVLS